MRGGSDVPWRAAAKSSPPAKAGARPDEPEGAERRHDTRVRSQYFLSGGIDGAAKPGSSSFLGTTVDLSMGGCLFRTYESLDLGMDVTVTLKLPEGDLNARGRIVHMKEDAVGCRVCGLRFAPLASDPRALLTRHLSRYASVEPPAADNETSPAVRDRRARIESARGPSIRR